MMTLKQLESIIEHQKNLDKIFCDAYNVGIIDINGPLFDAVWHTIEVLISIVDPYGWIYWYIYENDYGSKGLEAKSSKSQKLRKIKSIKHLYVLMRESEQP